MVRLPLVVHVLLVFVWLMVLFLLVLSVVLLFSCASSLSGEFLDCHHYVRSLLLADPKGGLLVVVA
jgi:hypothetical protein